MAAYNFPNSPSDGDTVTSNGITYTYSSSKTRWDGAAASGSSTTVYATIDLLPLSGASTGDQAYVSGNNRLYIWNGTGWYNIALINTTPSISGASASYNLATDGTATTVTITATDPEGIPITYSIASDTSGNVATVTQGTGSNTNVFTITPSTNTANAGTFSLTFRASDGVNIATAVSSFTLQFAIENSNYTTALITSVGANNAVNNSFDDASTNNHTITASGNATQNTFSPYRHGGYSTYFDGSGDYLSVASSSVFDFGSSDFTMECWVYLDADGDGAGGIIEIYSDDNNYIRLHRATGPDLQLRGASGGTTQFDIQSSAQSRDKWIHVAAVRNGSTIALYLDGTQVGTDSSFTIPSLSSAQVLIGADLVATDRYFTGYITDVRIVKGTAVYTSAFTPPTERLTAITNTSLLTCHLPYIADGSTNSHSITVNGNTKTEPFSPYNYDQYTTSDFGGSGYFSGLGDHISGPSGSGIAALGSGDFCIEFWIYPTIDSTLSALLDYRPHNSSPSGLVLIWRDTANKVYLFANGSQRILADDIAPTNMWTHVAVVRNSGTHYLYINGKQQTTTWADSSTWGTNSSRPIFMQSGYHYSGNSSGNYFNTTGHMADARIVVGSPVYTADFTPPTAPLTAITNTSLLINGTDAGIIDKSQCVKTITLNGDVKSSTTQSKYLTSSMYFDGTGDTLSLPDSPSLNFGSGDSTIEMWVYPLGTGTFNLMTRGTSGYSGFILSSTGFLESTNGSSWSVNITFSTAITANSWQHVAAVRNGSAITIYRNGTSVGTASISGSVSSAAQSLVIGARAGQSNFQGYMSDVRITKGLARYTSNFTVPSAALQG